MSKAKILVSCYACGPNRGSEPGMGWNFITGLSQFHELHVIVEKEKWQKSIEQHLLENPQLKENLHFYFIQKQRNRLLRKLWPPSYYWYYKKWQKQALGLAKQLQEKESFDIVHQLNMVGYREPGYLWQLDIPFIWGPIGGLQNTPWSFFSELNLKGKAFHAGRNIWNSIQRKFLSRPKLAAKRPNSILIAATPDNKELIKKYWNTDSIIMAEVGTNAQLNKETTNRPPGKPINIIWSGQHTPGKALNILLKSLSQLNKEIDWELNILGEGEQTKSWKALAQRLNIHQQCHWHGWVQKDTALEIASKGHLQCISSLKDLTSTVTLEALQLGLPIICLDHCGFSHVVNNSCGVKIKMQNPTQVKADMAKAIEKLYHDEVLRERLSQGALQRAQDFEWPNKIKDLNKLYQQLLTTKQK